MTKSSFCSHLFSIGTLAAGLLLAGCNGEDTPLANAPGPAGYSAFSGVTIEINPTISFLSNGQVTYLNTAAGSSFPAATTAISGTYTYTPATDYLTGTLTLTLPGLGQTLQFTLQSFTTQGGAVTSFTTIYNGQSYSSTVTSGALAAATVPGGTASAGSSSGGTNTGGSTPSTPSGGTGSGGSELVFSTTSTDAPYSNGQRVAFTLTQYANSAQNTLQFSGKTLTNPTQNTAVTAPYSAFTFLDAGTSTSYEVIIKDNTTLHEINVSVNNVFKGQFAADGSTSSGGDSSSGGSGGGTTLPSGPLAAGTTFTRTVSVVSIAPPGASLPSDVPVYSVGQQVAFTVNSAGDLTFSGMTVPYVSDGGSALVYVKVISAGNSDTVNVFKNLTTGAPTGIAMQFVRTSAVVPPIVLTVSYTLE